MELRAGGRADSCAGQIVLARVAAIGGHRLVQNRWTRPAPWPATLGARARVVASRRVRVKRARPRGMEIRDLAKEDRSETYEAVVRACAESSSLQAGVCGRADASPRTLWGCRVLATRTRRRGAVLARFGALLDRENYIIGQAAVVLYWIPGGNQGLGV